MNKNTFYLNIKKTAAVIFLFLVVFSSCNEKHSEELSHLSLLQEKLSSNRDKLNFDIAPFVEREKEIETNLVELRNNIKDTMTPELGNQLDKYKSIKKIYSKNILKFNTCKKEQEELETQLVNLESDLKNNKLSKEEFKEYYRIEKQDIEVLIENTAGIQQAIVEVEPEFRRLSVIVYENLKKYQPTPVR